MITNLRWESILNQPKEITQEELQELELLAAEDDNDDCCDSQSPNMAFLCTRLSNHSGPHIAHGYMNRVLGVWD